MSRSALSLSSSRNIKHRTSSLLMNGRGQLTIVSEPKQNNGVDYGVFVCMIMYCMMKGWDLNSIPVDAYNIRLRLFVVYYMLRCTIGTEDYSFSQMSPAQDNAFMMIFIEQDLIPKKDRGAYNHV
jgi:hypothetical protein